MKLFLWENHQATEGSRQWGMFAFLHVPLKLHGIKSKPLRHVLVSTGGGGRYRDQRVPPASQGRGQPQACKLGSLTTHTGLVFYHKTMTCSMALLALDTTLLITMACLNSHEAKSTGFKKKNEYLGVWLSGRALVCRRFWFHPQPHK